MSNFKGLPPFRQAKLSDGPFIYRLLREFYAKQGGVYDIPMDAESAADTIHQVISTGICLVGNHSCAGALLSPFPFNRHEIIAQVIFWYFTSPREIQIFKQLAVASKIAGATHINASSHFPDNRIMRYYERIGLRPVETQGMCRL